jgi:hypothetical protein
LRKRKSMSYLILSPKLLEEFQPNISLEWQSSFSLNASHLFPGSETSGLSEPLQSADSAGIGFPKEAGIKT